jgi:hypothetical protein
VAQLLSKIDNAQVRAVRSGRIPHRLAGNNEESNFEIARATLQTLSGILSISAGSADSAGFRHSADENENTGR